MRILLLTQLFQPEPNLLKGVAFARELVRRGHRVEILTGFPNYPGGTIYPGYRVRPWMKEELDGIPVTRVALYPSHDRSSIRRMACYASFAAAAALLGPLLVKKPDVVHVYQGPATLAWPAMVFRAMFGAPSILDVQDLWPDSVFSTGLRPPPGAAWILDLWCKLSYRLARAVVASSEGCRRVLLERGVPASKIRVVHNWCDEQAIPGPEEVAAPDALGLRSHGGFQILYAGNLGTVQSLDTVLDAAARLAERRSDIRFVLVGDGVEGPRLRRAARDRGLCNVLFAPRLPPERLKGVLAAADALLIHLKDDPLSRIGIPQKTQTALASGKPVLMAVRGSAADLVRESGAGIVCEPGNSESLAEAALALRAVSEERRRAMGARGRSFYRDRLAFSVGIERWLEIYAATAS